jgi:hypothetical protein
MMRSRALVVSLAGLTVAAAPLGAQDGRGVISGVVRDEAGAPLSDVEVMLDPLRRDARLLRTDQRGRYWFDAIDRGVHTIRFRKLAYFPDERAVVHDGVTVSVDIVLRRVPDALDTIRITGHRVGIVGFVVAQQSFRGLPGAEVTILRTRASATTDVRGRFALTEGVKSGPQMVMAKAKGFATSFMSVTVPESSTAQVALALTTPSFPGARRVAMPLAEFERRAHWMGRGAALVTRSELAEFRGQSLERVLPHVMSLRRRGFIVSDGCVLINGWQMGRSTHDIDADEVEAVEVYLPGTDYTGTLAARGCLASDAIGRLSARPFSGTQRSVGGLATIVVWLKS